MKDRISSDRRQFLTGMGLDPLGLAEPAETGFGSSSDQAASPFDDSRPLMTYSTNAMGCQFQVLATQEGQRGLVPSIHDGFELIARLEQQLTTYDSGSELQRLNRHGFLGSTPVSQNLFNLLCAANSLSEKTNGAFDITAAPLCKLWNFHQRDGRMPNPDSIAEVIQQVGFRNLRFDREGLTVSFANERLQIDLGGIGKGYALDELTQMFVERGGTDFVVHGGQSSIVIRGCRGEIHGEPVPWRVGISHPLIPAKRLATILLQDEAMGTSGSGRQSFIHNGRRYGHIIDPRCGWPADHRLSVTVIASKAATADALATALFVMDDDQLVKWAGENAEIGILALRHQESTGKLIADLFNIEAQRIHWIDHSTIVCNR